mmetsp:Transcript_5876/g.8296  ORF Transcript_5876/g.8296 Transcript_5876/m.8296 type:complete len:292 (-) Transcript_5876:30-905(-)
MVIRSHHIRSIGSRLVKQFKDPRSGALPKEKLSELRNSYSSSSKLAKGQPQTQSSPLQRPLVTYVQSEEKLHFVFSPNDSDVPVDEKLILSPHLSQYEHIPLQMTTSNAPGRGDVDDDDHDMVSFIAAEIENRYSLDEKEHESRQFVGGMGESDGGVWFSSDGKIDTLAYWKEIRNIIEVAKEHRHGIPFGIYTSGLTNVDPIQLKEEELNISSIIVSLLSHSPNSYGSVAGIDDLSTAQRKFGQVCNFIASASEVGFPVTAAIAGGKHSSAGTELAKALGAIDVVVYDSI